jgi:hypothetical protein
MAIQDRIKEAIDKLNLNDPINALIQVSIAIDGTAKKMYPGKKTSFRCKKFLEDNRGFISRVAFGKLEIQGPILFLTQTSKNSKKARPWRRFYIALYDVAFFTKVNCQMKSKLSQRNRLE